MKTFKQFIAPIATWAKTNLPEILISLGIASYASATIFAVTGTVKAVKTVEELIDEKGEVPTKVEILKATWKHYIPVVLTFTAGTVCVIVSNRESAKRIAALVTAYSMSEKKVEGYSKKIEELLGKEKASEIESAVEQKNADEGTTVYDSDDSEIKENVPDVYIPLMYDSKSGRYFRCSETQLQAAVNKINELILSFDTATVNDFYFEIGLKDTDDGGVFGWNVDSAHPMRITSDSYITCPVTGEHAKVISYNCKYLY